MKYKVGDKVRIRGDLKAEARYDDMIAVPEMEQYKGKPAIIKRICDTDGGYYLLNIDNEFWAWTDDMFEKTDSILEDIEPTPIKKNTPRNVDIGYYLEYCGHRVIKNVYYGGYAHDHNHIFCTTDDGLNQYTLPIDSIEFIIPHEDYDMAKESKEYE